VSKTSHFKLRSFRNMNFEHWAEANDSFGEVTFSDSDRLLTANVDFLRPTKKCTYQENCNLDFRLLFNREFISKTVFSGGAYQRKLYKNVTSRVL
jgi:hypothetical protein